MANLEWLLCLLRVAMYWDAHAYNDVTDTSTECRVHLPYSEWRVAGCALSYRVVTSLPLNFQFQVLRARPESRFVTSWPQLFQLATQRPTTANINPPLLFPASNKEIRLIGIIFTLLGTL